MTATDRFERQVAQVDHSAAPDLPPLDDGAVFPLRGEPEPEAGDVLSELTRSWRIEFDAGAPKDLRPLDRQVARCITLSLRDRIGVLEDPRRFGATHVEAPPWPSNSSLPSPPNRVAE